MDEHRLSEARAAHERGDVLGVVVRALEQQQIGAVDGGEEVVEVAEVVRIDDLTRAGLDGEGERLAWDVC